MQKVLTDMAETTFIGIIPARYASTRFPGKPLADLGGCTVIERVYRRVASVLGDNVAVATDDERILHAVESFGGKAVMTSSEHRSGTDRCLEAYRRLGSHADVVINIQGDEPFIAPEQIQAVMGCFDSGETASPPWRVLSPRHVHTLNLPPPTPPKSRSMPVAKRCFSAAR